MILWNIIYNSQLLIPEIRLFLIWSLSSHFPPRICLHIRYSIHTGSLTMPWAHLDLFHDCSNQSAIPAWNIYLNTCFAWKNFSSYYRASENIIFSVKDSHVHLPSSHASSSRGVSHFFLSLLFLFTCVSSCSTAQPPPITAHLLSPHFRLER